jgi:tetratricopeptide (TPR) repeat protein
MRDTLISKSLAAVVLVGSLVVVGCSGATDETANPPPQTAAEKGRVSTVPATAALPAQALAKAEFEHGSALYDEGRYGEAAEAFGRAYAASPNYRVLYNIGYANMQAGNTKAALDAFEAFLRQADTKVPESRRAKVEQDLATLRARL